MDIKKTRCIEFIEPKKIVTAEVSIIENHLEGGYNVLVDGEDQQGAMEKLDSKEVYKIETDDVWFVFVD